jgi:2-polyprenyl-6-methoxyphenol hydroxylase-like FAD-dependent oxidoreductase
VRLGLSVKSLSQDDSGVDVVFTDGTEGRYAVVVGADGVNSTIRRMVFGNENQPRFMGQGCWRFTTERPQEIENAFMYHGRKSLAGLIPLTPKHMYLLLLTEEKGNPWFAPEELRTRLAERLAEYGGLIGELAQRIPDASEIVYRPLEPLLLPAPWTHGRVVLIGDAAHTTTPHIAQGSSMAFEDAVVLAELLCSGGDEVSNLLQFTSRRYERCKLIVNSSVQIGKWQLQAWNGDPDPTADPITLSTQVLEALRAPL